MKTVSKKKGRKEGGGGGGVRFLTAAATFVSGTKVQTTIIFPFSGMAAERRKKKEQNKSI